jgi:cell division protein FtsW
VAVTGVFALLVLVEPDLGTATTLTLMAFAMLVVAGAKPGKLAAIAGTGVALAMLAIAVEPYRRDRLLIFLDPWSDPHGAGFQIVQAEIALGSGGLGGVGIGDGLQKVFYLPEAHTDMIVATVGEELGLLGVIGLLAAFGVIAWCGYTIALNARDLYQQVLAAGLTTLIVMQAAVNFGAVLGLLPVTGVPLPFVSFGGSSLIVLLASAGILVNIGRRRATGSRSGGLRVVDGEGGDRSGRDGRARDAGARAGRGAAGAGG